MQALSEIFEGAFFMVVLWVMGVLLVSGGGASVQADRDKIIVAMAKKVETERNVLGPNSASIEDGIGARGL
jgi:hypothetical protein